MTKQELFGDIDFKMLVDNPDFKEASVREFIISPILNQLGFTSDNLILEKSVQVQTGSKKQTTAIYADYVLKVDGKHFCVIEAKSPQKNINDKKTVEQAFSYAYHDLVRSPYFALCNGVEFALYTSDMDRTKLLHFFLEDIEDNWEDLESVLSLYSLQNYITPPHEPIKKEPKRNPNFDYLNRDRLPEIPVKKQAAKRHFGVHGYFTSQAWNVVQKYIKHYTQEGDLVLDPFGGKGVTAIEAMMADRKAITVDLNPMAVFITQSLIAPVNFYELHEAFEKIKNEYLKLEPKTNAEVSATLKKYEKQLPKDLQLPKSSDVKTVRKLFTKKQLAQLVLLKSLIVKVKDKNIKASLMLMFSGLVSKANLTVHSNESIDEGKKATGGFDCAPFRYYRYRLAPNPKTPDEEVIEEVIKNNKKATGGFNCGPFQYYRYRVAPYPKQLNILDYFESRYKRIFAAKKEIEEKINFVKIENIDVRKGTATDLSFIENETVDYIYTDPPYGKKIPYLDLSTMWNAWLDLDVTEEDYKLEAIEGGERNKSKQEYCDLIAKSIREMYRVLKFDRWLSFVFAHKDPDFWHLIVETAENCGFEYHSTVTQSNGHRSFKKIQHPLTVLTGQLIINFKKTRNPKSIVKGKLDMSTLDALMQTIEGVIAANNGATIEQINNEVVVKGIELNFMYALRKEYDDITPILMANFDYNPNTEKYYMRKNTRFTSHINLETRIKYYINNFLGQKGREGKNPTFDEIVFYVMPLLKNGATPEGQTILNVLESIAERVGKDGWKLSNGELF